MTNAAMRYNAPIGKNPLAIKEIKAASRSGHAGMPNQSAKP
jgi:hypothetical protein